MTKPRFLGGAKVRMMHNSKILLLNPRRNITSRQVYRLCFILRGTFP